MQPIYRGQIFFVSLGPVVGKESNTKRRPVAVLSIDEINRKPLVVAVVPGTSWKAGQRNFWNEIKVEASPTNGLSNATLFQCHQIKALDHSRFDQDPVGFLSNNELASIERTLWTCLGFPKKNSN